MPTTKSDLSAEDHAQINKAARQGILIPRTAFVQARDAELPFPVACAFLVQETGGGRNVWGHDETWMVGYPVMNEDTYNVYKVHRDFFGNQGVGPMQLTSDGFQDRADQLGGCWKPDINCFVAFEYLAGLKKEGRPWREVAGVYNGGPGWRQNPRAVTYANSVEARIGFWREVLK